MLKDLAVKIATIFGIGKCKVMPGTIGALLGTLFYATTIQKMNTSTAVFIMILLLLFSIVVCDVAEKFFKQKDPSCIIFDEFVVMPICFCGIQGFAPPQTSPLMILLIGFIIFRIFDICKPLGIRRLQNLPGGLGIVIDDVVAAIYTNLVLVLICLTVR